MAKRNPHSNAPAPRLRTPDQVADSAIQRFSNMTADGASVDSMAWRIAISAEARAFALELIGAAATIARNNKTSLTPAQLEGLILDSLAEAAG